MTKRVKAIEGEVPGMTVAKGLLWTGIPIAYVWALFVGAAVLFDELFQGFRDPEFVGYLLAGAVSLAASFRVARPWDSVLRMGAIPLAVGLTSWSTPTVAAVAFLGAAVALLWFAPDVPARAATALVAVMGAFLIVEGMPGTVDVALTVALLAATLPLLLWAALEHGDVRWIPLGGVAAFALLALGFAINEIQTGFIELAAFITAGLVLALAIAMRWVPPVPRATV